MIDEFQYSLKINTFDWEQMISEQMIHPTPLESTDWGCMC